MFRFPGTKSGSTSRSTRQTQRLNNIGEEPAPVTVQKKKKKGTTAELPNKLKRVRACMLCSLIKTESEFEEDGCDNCEAFLHLKGTKGAVLSYTSANFEGMIAMIQPEESWVARWQRIATLKAGAYAINVRGEVDQWVKDEITDAGLPYICRDKTQISDAKLAQREKLMHKRKRNRRRKPSSESNEDENHANGSTVVLPRIRKRVEKPEDTDEPEPEDPGPVDNASKDAVVNTSPLSPVDLPIIKSEPLDGPTETGSLVGNMPYRSGRRFSSSSSSSEDSDAEPFSKGSYSP